MRTAEFVSPKHADKLCDRISDTILDRFLLKDSNSRCAIETIGNRNKVLITGEVSSNGYISDNEIHGIVREISGVEDVDIHIHRQPNDNNQMIDLGLVCNSGTVIGYASRETKNNMPFEYELARQLNKFIYKHFPFDGKTQVTINGSDVSVFASFQYASKSNLEELIYDFFTDTYKDITSTPLKVYKTFCNPLGDYTSGGFESTIGFTGRRNIIDNYGPRVPNGGGFFSGKDATKINRSAGYMARRIAVDSLSKYQLSYAIVELSYVVGNEHPIQARIKGNTRGIDIETGVKLYEVTDYDLSINGIINFLDLKKPQYSDTSMWGHMGHDFNWK